MAALFPDRIETNRLVLTPVHEADPIEYYEICAHDDGIEEVTEYMPWTPHDTPKESQEFLESRREAWEEEHSADYVIQPKESEPGGGQIAGTGALGIDWDRRIGTLGAWLRKPYWGRGYSGERAAALMAVGFDHLALDLIEVTHQAGNEKSRRAIEKYIDAHGGRHEGLLRSYEPADLTTGGAVDARRYTVTAEEFEAHRGEPPEY